MKNSDAFHLFVYGSLRSGFLSPAYEYISRYFTLISAGRVQGCLYDMGDYPAAVPASDGWIHGELYVIKDEQELSWALAQLDDYEGVLVEPDEQPLYRREIATIHCNESTEKAWIYWYNGDTTGRPAVESGDIIDYIKKKG